MSGGASLTLTKGFLNQCMDLTYQGKVLPEGLNQEGAGIFERLQQALKQPQGYRSVVSGEGVFTTSDGESFVTPNRPLLARASKKHPGEMRYHPYMAGLGHGSYATVIDLPFAIKKNTAGDIVGIYRSKKVAKVFKDVSKLEREAKRYQDLESVKGLNESGLSYPKHRIEGKAAGAEVACLIMTKYNGIELYEADKKGLLNSERYSEATRLVFFYQLLSDLVRIHQLGFVHGDLKSENMMVSLEDFRVWAIDFGLCQKIGVQGARAGTTVLFHPPAIRRAETLILADYDNVGLACGLSALMGWGDPSFCRGWVQINAHDDPRIYSVSTQILPRKVKRVAHNHPVLKIIEKLLVSTNSELPDYYVASDALQELWPIIHSALLLPESISKLDLIIGHIRKEGAPLVHYKLGVLWELKQLLCIPKDGSGDFIARRASAIDQFLLDHESVFSHPDLADLMAFVIAQLKDANILLSHRNIGSFIQEVSLLNAELALRLKPLLLENRALRKDARNISDLIIRALKTASEGGGIIQEKLIRLVFLVDPAQQHESFLSTRKAIVVRQILEELKTVSPRVSSISPCVHHHGGSPSESGLSSGDASSSEAPKSEEDEYSFGLHTIRIVDEVEMDL